MFDKIWQLMISCFPEDEHSSYEIQKNLFNIQNYNCKTIEEDNKLIGFVSYWDFESFIYIEHICVDKVHRGSGVGAKLINHIIALNKKIILEIEDTNIENNSKELKRLSFYEKLGFKKNPQEYYQQPLNKNDKPIKMEILTYPKLFTDDEIKDTISIIKDTVYKNRF